MAFLIDGNNVMGQTPGWHRDKTAARHRLIEQVAEFARVRKARVTVVFDGEPDDRHPEASAHRGVKVFYAERGSNADRRIEKLVESSTDRRGITVVTSDRHLATIVRARGALVMKSGEFRRLVESATLSRTRLEDGEQVEPGDLKEWLRYFGQEPFDE